MPLNQFLIYSSISYLNDKFISKIKQFCEQKIKPFLYRFLFLLRILIFNCGINFGLKPS